MANLIPTNELVAISWLKTVPGVPSNRVSTRLPGDNAVAASSGGFVTVLAVGGNSSIYLPTRSPVIEVRAWASNGNGDKEPPWWIANQIMESIRERCVDHSSFTGQIQTRSGYDNVYVPSAYLVSEPRKVEDDDGQFAIYTVELQLHWSVVPNE